MEVETLGDIAQELSQRYGAIKNFLARGEKSKVYVKILESLFREHGERFGFKNLSSFKSSIVQVKNNLKRTSMNKDWGNYSKPQSPSEGDEGIFTLDQIERYGLNTDSYF